jgi:hypothetical protein
MTTKVYGVDMELLQKLNQFKFLLKKRKFGKAVDKMEFVAFVQIQSDKELIPAIKQIAVVNTTILIEEGAITIRYAKSKKTLTTTMLLYNLRNHSGGWVGLFIL